MKHFAVLAAILLAATPALSHAPVIQDGSVAMTADDPYVIEEPQHSKAIFSELDGEPHFYRISSETDFRFYAGITQPKLDNCGIFQAFDFDVLDADMNVIDTRAGSEFDWWAWFEEYGETWYWVGPEIGENFLGNRQYDAGTYFIRVYNEDNTGKYVLAVGDEERFGFLTIAGMVLNRTMGKIREGWWNPADCPQEFRTE